MRFSRKHFFDSYRKAFGPVQQLQVEGLEFLLGKIEQDPEWDSVPEIAYFLSTIKHETGVSRNRIDQTYQPIKELRERAGTAKRRNQDRYWLSGYYGRGYTQLTWKDNYAKFGLADVPDDALQPDTAYMVAARGIREGKFTKYKLADFINDQEVDYFNARRVVNGLDKAEKIAEEAQKFERILRASLAADSVNEDTPAPPQAEQPSPQINIEHADQVKTDTPLPVEGGRKDDPAKQASQGGRKSTIATIFGTLAGIGTAIKGWMESNNMLAVVGVICITTLLLAWIFRQLIMDYVRLNYMSDPTRLNVK